jgi:hypothetical protein
MAVISTALSASQVVLVVMPTLADRSSCLLYNPGSAAADELTFSFLGLPVTGIPPIFTVVANQNALTAGIGLNVLATDSTTGTSIPFAGLVSVHTGPASSLSFFPGLVVGTFDHGIQDSVALVDLSFRPLILGTVSDNGALVATFPGGTGAFLSGFDLTYVSPVIMQTFGLGHFDSRGAVSFTFGQTTETLNQLTGNGGGGTITIEGTPIPDPSTAVLFPSGILLISGAWKLRRRLNRPKSGQSGA